MAIQRKCFTSLEINFIKSNAGKITARDMAIILGYAQSSIKNQAKKLNIDLTCYKSNLRWCDSCSTYRATINPDTGLCQVCRLKRMLEKIESNIADALKKLGVYEIDLYSKTESKRDTNIPKKPKKQSSDPMSRYERQKAEDQYLRDIEQWEIKIYTRKVNSAKQRLKRIRDKAK